MVDGKGRWQPTLIYLILVCESKCVVNTRKWWDCNSNSGKILDRGDPYSKNVGSLGRPQEQPGGLSSFCELCQAGNCELHALTMTASVLFGHSWEHSWNFGDVVLRSSTHSRRQCFWQEAERIFHKGWDDDLDVRSSEAIMIHQCITGWACLVSWPLVSTIFTEVFVKFWQVHNAFVCMNDPLPC